MRVGHVGILVAEAVGSHYLGSVGEWVEDKVQQAFVTLIQCDVELIAPNGEDSHLAGKKPGLHHLCLVVPDLKTATATLRAAGLFPISEPTPAVLFDGRSIAWFADRDGLLIELLEEE